MLIARGRELQLQLIEVELRAGAEEKRERGDVRRRAHAHQRSRRGHDRDVEFAALDAIKRREPLRDEIVVRRELVVRQRLPVGQETDSELRREPRDLIEQALRIERGRADHRDRMLFLREARERERVSRTGEPGIASAGGKRIALHQETKRVIISS